MSLNVTTDISSYLGKEIFTHFACLHIHIQTKYPCLDNQ